MLKNLHIASVITAYATALSLALWTTWSSFQNGGSVILPLTENAAPILLSVVGLALFASARRFSFWFNVVCFSAWTVSVAARMYWQLSLANGLFFIYPWAESALFAAIVISLATIFLRPCRAFYKAA